MADVIRSDLNTRLTQCFNQLKKNRGKTIENDLSKTTKEICKEFDINLEENLSEEKTLYNELCNLMKFDYEFMDFRRLVQKAFLKKAEKSDAEFKSWYDNQKGSYLAKAIFPYVFDRIDQMIELLLKSIKNGNESIYNDEIEKILQPYLFLKYFDNLAEGMISFEGSCAGGKANIPKRAFNYKRNRFRETIERNCENGLRQCAYHGVISCICASPDCLELIENGKCKFTHCGHRFHENCLLNALDATDHCPCCHSFLDYENDSSQIIDSTIEASMIDTRLDISHCRSKQREPCVELVKALHEELKKLVETTFGKKQGNEKMNASNSNHGDHGHGNMDVHNGCNGGNGGNGGNGDTNDRGIGNENVWGAHQNCNSEVSGAVAQNESEESQFMSFGGNNEMTDMLMGNMGNMGSMMGIESSDFGEITELECDDCARKDSKIVELTQQNANLLSQVAQLTQEVNDLKRRKHARRSRGSRTPSVAATTVGSIHSVNSVNSIPMGYGPHRGQGGPNWRDEMNRQMSPYPVRGFMPGQAQCAGMAMNQRSDEFGQCDTSTVISGMSGMSRMMMGQSGDMVNNNTRMNNIVQNIGDGFDNNGGNYDNRSIFSSNMSAIGNASQNGNNGMSNMTGVPLPNMNGFGFNNYNNLNFNNNNSMNNNDNNDKNDGNNKEAGMETRVGMSNGNTFNDRNSTFSLNNFEIDFSDYDNNNSVNYAPRQLDEMKSIEMERPFVPNRENSNQFLMNNGGGNMSMAGEMNKFYINGLPSTLQNENCFVMSGNDNKSVFSSLNNNFGAFSINSYQQ